MSELENIELSELIQNKYDELLSLYGQVMYLKIFIDCEDDNLIELYTNAVKKHNEKLLNFKNLDFIDAGFDLFAPNNEKTLLQTRGNDLYFYGPNNSQNQNPVNKLDFKVKTSAKMIKLNTNTKTKSNTNYISHNTGFYMYPRSSLSKTQLRLANSVGIIDAGYRGNLMGMFDVVNTNTNTNININTNADYIGRAYERYVQICAPALVPIIVKIVKSTKELGEITQRGDGGFGSTGK